MIYGHGVKPRVISVATSDFRKVYAQAGSSSLVDVAVDAATPVKALIQDVQVHHLTLQPIHIDFHEVRMDEYMHAQVPLRFVGESLAVKELGGTLVKALDMVEVKCLPADLPHELTVELSPLRTFDDAISIRHLTPPKGVQILTDASQTIVTVEAPLSEEQIKRLEESQLGDVTTVKSEAEIKRAEEAVKAAEEAKVAEK